MNTNYTFKKSAIEKSQYWELTEQGIVRRQQGRNDMHIPYSKVQSIRLLFLANNRYRLNNYCCRITAGKTVLDIYSSSYEGVGKFGEQASTYVPFVKELVQKTKTAHPACRILTGQTAAVYYGNLLLTVIVVIGLMLIFQYLPISWGLSLIIKLLLIGYLGFYILKSIKVNKPRQVEGSEIPDYCLPKI